MGLTKCVSAIPSPAARAFISPTNVARGIAASERVIAASFPEFRKSPYRSSRTVSSSPARSPMRVESQGIWLIDTGTVTVWSSRRWSRATSAVTILVRLAGAWRPCGSTWKRVLPLSRSTRIAERALMTGGGGGAGANSYSSTAAGPVTGRFDSAATGVSKASRSSQIRICGSKNHEATDHARAGRTNEVGRSASGGGCLAPSNVVEVRIVTRRILRTSLRRPAEHEHRHEPGHANRDQDVARASDAGKRRRQNEAIVQPREVGMRAAKHVGAGSTVHRCQDVVPFDRHPPPVRRPDDLVAVGAERAARDRINLSPDGPDAGGNGEAERKQPRERTGAELAQDEDRARGHEKPDRDRRPGC